MIKMTMMMMMKNDPINVPDCTESNDCDICQYKSGEAAPKCKNIITEFHVGSEKKYETFQSVYLVYMAIFEDGAFVIRS